MLHPYQREALELRKLIKSADIGELAKIGMMAVHDETTGRQDDRPAGALESELADMQIDRHAK